MLCAVDGTVLTSCASECEHEIGESSLEIAFDVCVGEAVDGVEEGEDLAIFFEETYDGLVESCEVLIGFVAAWVVGAAAVEDVASSVAGGVFRYAALVGE